MSAGNVIRRLSMTLAPMVGQMTRIYSALGVGEPDFDNCHKLFTFRTRRANPRKGTPKTQEIGLSLNRTRWINLTAHGIAPEFTERQDAYNWACDFAEAHGFQAMRRGPKKKTRRPKLTVLRGGAL